MTELSKNSIIYIPEGKPQGVMQILHGMADHQGRYRDMAQYLADCGYAVVTMDIKGHGNSVSRRNELGFFGDNAVSRITGSVHDNTIYIKEKFPGIPYALVGQGMGAMIAAIYFKKYDNLLNALILSGMPSYRILNPACDILLFILTALQGEYQYSKIADRIIMSK